RRRARRGRRRIARRHRRRVAAQRGAGRADRKNGHAGSLRCARYFRRDPASRRDDLEQGDRRGQQGSRRGHLQDRRLRDRRRRVRVRAGIHRSGQESASVRPFVGATERELAGAVADWASRKGVAERIPAAEKEGTLPRDVIAELGQLGVLGMTIPETDGGLGASAVAFALVLEELSAAWPSLAVGVAVNSGIVAGSIVRSATDEQRKRWLPKLMDGTGLGAFALTEPTSGSDAASLRSTARPEGNGWRIDGQKQFITNARYAPLAIVLARVGEFDAERTSAGITARHSRVRPQCRSSTRAKWHSAPRMPPSKYLAATATCAITPSSGTRATGARRRSTKGQARYSAS